MPDEKIVDFRDIEKHMAELERQVYIEDNHVIINVEYEYDIALSRCDTNEKLMAWVVHLCEKTWMTKVVLRRFIQLVQHHHELPTTNI